MNAITTTKATLPAAPAASARHIAALFVGKLSPHGGALTDALTREYLYQVRSFPEWVVLQATEEFRASGEKFAPFPGQLAERCREIQAEDNSRKRENREMREQISEVARLREMRESRTPEQKQRVKAAVERVKQSYAQLQAKEGVEDKEKREAEEWARVHARFDAQARSYLVKTLEGDNG